MQERSEETSEISMPAGTRQLSAPEPKSRAGPSGAELGYTLLAMCSFAAALYALWLASISFGLASATDGLRNSPAWSENVSPVAPAPAPVAWIPSAPACLAAGVFIWISFRMLGKSSALATGRLLFRLAQDLAIPDAIKLEVMLAATGVKYRRVPPTSQVQSQDAGVNRTLAAGKWVLGRFDEGSSVIALPESLIDPEILRAAVGGSDRPIQVLRNDQPFHKAEGVA